jgi:hypothetical protein
MIMTMYVISTSAHSNGWKGQCHGKVRLQFSKHNEYSFDCVVTKGWYLLKILYFDQCKL